MGKVGGSLLLIVQTGCVLAAAGAGAGGAIYLTDRGAEAVVAASVDRTLDASREAFREFDVTETRSVSEQDDGVLKRKLEGRAGDRDVEVEIRAENSNAKVNVVVKKSAVTWDKDFAKRLLNKIVEEAK